MKRNIYLTFIGVGMLAFSSCVDSYEKLPVEQFTIDYVFSRTDSLGKKAVGFLDEIYNMLDYGHNRVNGDYLDAASDDAISIDASDPDVYKMYIKWLWGVILLIAVPLIWDGENIMLEFAR